MRSFQEVPTGYLEWVQPQALTRQFELRWGNEVIATLAWTGLLGSLATGSTADATFTFKRAGFLKPYITVRLPAAGADLARLYMGWNGDGTLVFGDSRRYEFLRWGFWSPQWGFRDAYGRGMCRFSPNAGLVRSGAYVYLDELAARYPDLPLLVLLGWYAIRLYLDEQAAAVSAAAAAGTVAIVATTH